MCPGIQVIAYKAGTNCTASPYQFYTIDLSGVQSSTPFYTLTNTSKEVNGLGINGVDGFLYGIEYDRTPVGASCSFSNLHLMRYDAAGTKSDLGILQAPVGGAVVSSMGCVTREGDFIYSVIDGSGNRYIASIVNVAALAPSAGTITAIFKMLTNNCAIVTYADWSVNPVNNKLYTYGIYNNAGVSTGTVVEIDPVTGTVTCVGSTNTTEFLDPVRDNFGGVYFAPSGDLFGININTRKLYRIDVTNGNLLHVSTMSGSGQIRADMGSCANGSLLLPVRFKSTSIKTSNNNVSLSWEIGDAENLSHFIVETNIKNGFAAIESVPAESYKRKYNLTVLSSAATQYRIKAVLKSGTVVYSPVLAISLQKEMSVRMINPVLNDKIELNLPTNTGATTYRILNTAGLIMQQGRLTKTSNFAVSVKDLRPGCYFLAFDGQQSSLRFMKM